LAVVYQDIHRELIDLSKAGSRKAQYQLYQLYSKAMFNISMRMMPSQEEAEDVLQEAFTEAFLKLDSFRHESSFGAWLKRIVINRCINAIKKKKLELEYSDDIGQWDEAEENNSSDIDEKQMTVQAIHEAVKELPEGYRVIFTLYMFEGYDHGEIAQILNITESTSKSQYLRAKKKIKEHIKLSYYERQS
jgi:RNA polymerase sigma-70 factor (ECF subfamily)